MLFVSHCADGCSSNCLHILCEAVLLKHTIWLFLFSPCKIPTKWIFLCMGFRLTACPMHILFTLCWSTLSPTHFGSNLRNSKHTFNYKIYEIFWILEISGDHRRQIPYRFDVCSASENQLVLKSILVPRHVSQRAHINVCMLCFFLLSVRAIRFVTSAKRVDISCVQRFHFVCSFHSCFTVDACCVWFCFLLLLLLLLRRWFCAMAKSTALH